jgi:hypothetical protein
MPVAERRTMGMNGIALSKEEFGRTKLIDQLENWLAMLQFRGPVAYSNKRD